MTRDADYRRHSKAVTRGARWAALRLEALRRDGFECVACGHRGRLEVDHILPVRDRPDLAHDLTNLQSLCGGCHASKTAREVGFAPLPPERKAWRDLLTKGAINA
ncbi:HNH endonuclease [Acuticoccus sp. I52.16.1]|uniref:HNH endonuclease n=1 Tax=Acuticoccus sp. I52.16.1 TaxID=2928472 RepID=UPI001FD430A0|nr:HNH endonuclease [Acuticoccus sp. I52.16.1]UOM34862.1 HNH endonuclease [Acuticoccus sp. I52.16.1]